MEVKYGKILLPLSGYHKLSDDMLLYIYMQSRSKKCYRNIFSNTSVSFGGHFSQLLPGPVTIINNNCLQRYTIRNSIPFL